MQNIIKNQIVSVGANDPGRKLFDALIPLPHGTTYNSYLIKGSQKNALVDTVDPTKTDVLFANLQEAGVLGIDYIIINHAEQDHSGSLPFVLERFPDAKVLCSAACSSMLADLLQIPKDKIQIVNDKDTISLGDKTLEFIHVPWVHWPETMVTYLREDKILFSCDFFGSHFSTNDLFVFGLVGQEKAIKAYFAEIMMPFRSIIKNNLEKLKNYDIEIIAPSHGPIHKDVADIMDRYREWISDDVKNLVIIAYISMHGSTKLMVDRLAELLGKNGVEVRLYDISDMDLGEIATDLVDAAAVVIGTPCVLGGIHPSAAHLLYLANALRPKTKFLSVIGSYGWSGGMAEAILPMVKNLNAEVIKPVVVKGQPKEADFKEIERLADEIAGKLKDFKMRGK